jgi:hypothetical protein
MLPVSTRCLVIAGLVTASVTMAGGLAQAIDAIQPATGGPVQAPPSRKSTATAPLAPLTEGAKIAMPIATFSGLDKITGRIISFDVAINETVQFGALQVTPRVCYARPTTSAPLTDGFVEVDEITLENKIRRIFTGWMFADSPGLHAVEHAVYDVWLTDCKQPTPAPGPAAAAVPSAPVPDTAPAPKETSPKKPAKSQVP